MLVTEWNWTGGWLKDSGVQRIDRIRMMLLMVRMMGASNERIARLVERNGRWTILRNEHGLVLVKLQRARYVRVQQTGRRAMLHSEVVQDPIVRMVQRRINRRWGVW